MISIARPKEGSSIASIIVTAPPVTGEYQPMLQIAESLVQRGHAVTMVAGSRFTDQVAQVGARPVALTGLADFDDRRLVETHAEVAAAAAGPDQLNALFGLMGDGIPDEYRQLQDLLTEAPESALITNSVFLGGWPLALGAPGRRPERWVAVGCNPLALPSADTGPLGPVPVGPCSDQSVANLAANEAFVTALEPSRRRIEMAVREVGGSSAVPSFIEGIVTMPNIFASLTVPGFEFHRSDAPPSLRFVGILKASVGKDWQEPGWWGELDEGRPVVVVTQGTLANHDLGQLVRPTLDALANDDLLVVVALGRDRADLPGPIPVNARVEAFVPFAALLPKAAVLVTNGGFGATQQALSFGVPVIVAGATEDKPLVAARVAARGVGLDLGTSTPRPEQVRAAVLQVLNGPSTRAAASLLASEYASYDAIGEIERLLLSP